MLLSDNIKTFPDFAQENISDELKNKKRRFFNTPENIHKYLPKLLSYTPAQISRMCRIEYFDYDVFSFAKHEATALNRRPCYVLYNYFDRDIITNHSSYSKIDI